MILFTFSGPKISLVSRDLSYRPYSTGAERLWYKVQWEKAIGHVIVVDPFDPTTLLYLPSPQYHDLVKTALANKTPLTVVHSLEDSIPEERELQLNESTYRAFFINDVEIRAARKLKNTPPLASDTARRMIKELMEETKVLRYNLKTEDSRSWLTLVPDFLRCLTVPSLLWSKLRCQGIRLPETGHVSHDYDLSSWFPASRKPLDGWIPRGADESIHHYHQRCIASLEATLLARYAWAGATMIARSGRALNWVKAVLGIYIHLWQHNGLESASAVFAEARRLVFKHAAGTPESVALSGRLCVGISKGLPTILPRGLRRYISLDNSVTAYRVAIFALSVCDLVLYDKPPKFSTITDPYAGQQPLDCGAFLQEWRNAARAFRGRYGALSLPRFRGLHLTTKAGPFGRALASAPLDAVALESSPIYSAWCSLATDFGAHLLIQQVTWIAWLCRAIFQYIPAYTDEWIHRFRSRLSTCRQWPYLETLWPQWKQQVTLPVLPVSRRLGTYPTGKISTKLEPRGKVRIFAIPGYWIQAVLRPLHDSIFDYLKELPRDNTFEQLAGVERIMASKAKKIWSYDLSAATDRFPLRLQQVVLEELLSGQKSEAVSIAAHWAELLRGTEFFVPKLKRTITYSVGQPMGSYSSWATFTLSHHILVLMAARRAGIPHNEEFHAYEILGDDIAFYGDTPQVEIVAEAYRVLCDSIGVTINPSKGVVSSNGTFEFAKRFVQNGHTLTTLKWRELASCCSNASFLALVKRYRKITGHVPHLRSCLEIYYALVKGIPCPKPLHRLSDSSFTNLCSRRGVFGAIIVLLTGPTGPYMSTFVDWLSNRAVALADFHPNIGRYVNTKDTMYVLHSRVATRVVAVARRLQSELVARLLRGAPLTSTMLATFSRALDIGPKAQETADILAYNYANDSGFTGYIRTLVQNSPGYTTVARAVRDLVEFGIDNEYFKSTDEISSLVFNLHPDRNFALGLVPNLWIGRPYNEHLGTPCKRESNELDSILSGMVLPTCEFLPPGAANMQLRNAGSLSAFATAKIDSFLPSALPAFGYELTDVIHEFEAKAVLRLYDLLRPLSLFDAVPMSAYGPTPDLDLSALPRLSFFDDIRIAWKDLMRVPTDSPEFPSLDAQTPASLSLVVPSVFPVARRESLIIPIAADLRQWSEEDQRIFDANPYSDHNMYMATKDTGPALGVPRS